MKQFAWVTPQSLADAATSIGTTVADAMGGLDAAPSIAKAGGIDLLDLMKEGLVAPDRIVDLRSVRGLDAITESDDGSLRIGALATLDSVATSSPVRRRYAALAAAVASAGSPQLRNVATLGGNLLQRPHCWYFRSADFSCLRKGGHLCFALTGENQYHAIFDNHLCAIVHPSTAATALVALHAIVELTASNGRSRQIALEDFIVGPTTDIRRENDLRAGEILVAVRLPPLSPRARSIHLKQGEKSAFDWPLADVAVVLDFAQSGICQNASIVLGSAAPVPYRASRAERLLVGRPVVEEAATAAARAAIAGATPLTKNRYKLPIFAALVRRAILRAANGE